MNKEEFDCLNTLSVKVINNIFTPNKVKEFKCLLTFWN